MCFDLSRANSHSISPLWRRAAEVVLALVALTIAAGGFVAGTRAGFVYNTFPLMGGQSSPPTTPSFTHLSAICSRMWRRCSSTTACWR